MAFPPVRFVPAPRLPRAWVLLAVLGAGVLAGGEAWLGRRWGFAACPFKAATGYPCPTCGATRGALALLSGHPLAALGWNPLVFTALALGLIYLAIRFATGLELHLDWDRRSRRTALTLGIGAVLANWAYLLWRGL